MLAFGSRRVDACSAGSSAAAAAFQVPVRRLPHLAVEIAMIPRDVVNRRLRFSLQSERRRTEVILVTDCCGSRERRGGGMWMPAAVGDCTALSDLEEENRGGDAVAEVELDDEASGTSRESAEVGRDRTAEVMIAAGVTVVLGVGNRILYKLALVPLKQYPFFLAQLATFGYVFVYFSILYLRYKAGIVTNEMLSLPKAPYVAVGLFEALAAACGMAAGAMLPGAAITILSQSFLVWQLLLSYVFLGRRYRFNQLFGCFLVATGVIVTVASGSSAGSLIQGGTFWSLLMIVSFLLQAADTVLKEIIFLSAARQLKGGSVDLFVVNSHGSAFQALFICLLLPFLSNLRGIPFSQLPSYLKDGAGCFLNNGVANGCSGAPLLPLLFVLVNMGFNISLLHLLKISSAVYSCLASTISVPISVFLFTLPLPYLGVGSSLPPGFLAGAVVLVLGMLIYTWTPSSTTTRNSTLSEPCCS